jgi:hypothetical protein
MRITFWLGSKSSNLPKPQNIQSACGGGTLAAVVTAIAGTAITVLATNASVPNQFAVLHHHDWAHNEFRIN